MASNPQSPGIGQELRSDAGNLTETAKNRAFEEVDTRKSAATQQVKSVASALDQAAGGLDDSPEWLRSAFRSGSQALQRFADSVETSDARQLGSQVQQFARSNPATFIGACAAAGFIASRVLKAGSHPSSSTSSSPGVGGSTGASEWQTPSYASGAQDYGSGESYTPRQSYNSEEAMEYGDEASNDADASSYGSGLAGGGSSGLDNSQDSAPDIGTRSPGQLGAIGERQEGGQP